MLELLDGADAGQQEGGEPGSGDVLRGCLDPGPVRVAAGAVVQRPAGETVAVSHLDGVDAGVFHTADPRASAWRLCALLDGLGLQVVLHQSTMSRAQMGRHVRLAASRELGYEPTIGVRG